MKPRDPDYADNLLREAIAASASGLDLVLLSDAQQNLTEALREVSLTLKSAKYSKKNPEQLARASAHITKSLDMVTRLAEFAKGKPDSRPHLAGDWLSGLTEEQLGQVENWVRENADRHDAAEAELHEGEAKSGSRTL